MFSLPVLEIRGFTIIGCEHRQLTIGIYEPCVHTKTITTESIVIDLLQNVEILERSGTITFLGMILTHYIVVIIIDIDLLVMVSIFIIVGG